MISITDIAHKTTKINLDVFEESMFTKKEAVEFAKSYNWTATDAQRAYANIDIENSTKEELITALLDFAGPELLERQRLQAAQKAQVTKKKNYIEKIESDFANKMIEADQQLSELRSSLIPVIARLYNFGKPFGLKDPWIDALLVTYNNYVSRENDKAI